MRSSLPVMFGRKRNTEVNNNLKERYKNGRNVCQKIDEETRLTGGALFEANILLDDKVLEMRDKKENEKSYERVNVIKNEKQKFRKIGIFLPNFVEFI